MIIGGLMRLAGAVCIIFVPIALKAAPPQVHHPFIVARDMQAHEFALPKLGFQEYQWAGPRELLYTISINGKHQFYLTRNMKLTRRSHLAKIEQLIAKSQVNGSQSPGATTLSPNGKWVAWSGSQNTV